jgi:hypothetical protein
VSVLKNDAQHYEMVKTQVELHMTPSKRAKKYMDLDERILLTVNDCTAGTKTIGQCLHSLAYWVPQNSRNNSMKQCQLMLEDNGKNNFKNLYLLDLKMWVLKRCSFDLIYFKH